MFDSAKEYIQDQAEKVTQSIAGPFMWYGNVAGAIWGAWMLFLALRWAIGTATSSFYRWQANGPGWDLLWAIPVVQDIIRPSLADKHTPPPARTGHGV